jgi:SAM-dependent methyltransferase
VVEAAQASVKTRLDAAWYPQCEDQWDARAFRQRVLAVIDSQTRMLDIGAGRGATPHMRYRGLVAEIVGVDVDAAGLENDQVDRAVHTPDGRLTELDADSFDVVISKDVLEHVDDPDTFFREVARVLKPGGLFLAKTPNSTHYVPIIARLTPLSLHKTFNKLRGRDVVDTFPTRYRANSRGALTRLARASGLEVVAVEFQEARPEYLRFHPLPYFLGMAYERTVNALKAVIYLTLRKPVGGS